MSLSPHKRTYKSPLKIASLGPYTFEQGYDIMTKIKHVDGVHEALMQSGYYVRIEYNPGIITEEELAVCAHEGGYIDGMQM